MYIVRDKKTHDIIHINPAPVDQQLSPQEVYYQFDPKIMELGRTDGSLPELFHIEKNGDITEASLAEQVEAGIISLEPTQKIEGTRIVEKTLTEQVEEERVRLAPTQKIDNEQIVEKTLEEQIGEGLIELAPTQKVKNDQIVEKPLKDQVTEGLLTLNEPFQFIKDNEIAVRTVQEALQEKLISTVEQCQLAQQMVNKEIELKIGEQFSPGYELKVAKAYMDWLREGQPADDPREQAYREMQAAIDTIKSDYRDIKDKVKALLATLEQK